MGVSEDYPQEMFVYVCVAPSLKSGNIHCFLKRAQEKQLSKETQGGRADSKEQDKHTSHLIPLFCYF